MKKSSKAFLVALSIILLIFVSLIAVPFLFQDKIMELAKKELNKQLNAEVDFDKLNVSLLRNFPDASLSLKKLKIIGKGDFAKDTLLYSNDINMIINLKSLFFDTGYEVKKLIFNDSRVLAHVLKDGRANWDIMKPDSTNNQNDTTASTFKFKLQNFRINNANIVYKSDTSNVIADMKNLNLILNGDLTAKTSLLTTKFTVDTLNFWYEGIKYVNKMTLDVSADIHADLKTDRYTLANNLMKINAIPLTMNGWVQLLDEGYNMDLKLNADKADFKSILSLIPAIYAESFNSLKAGGKVNLNGFIKGKYVGENYPAFDLSLGVNDGWFQYPNLPKSVQKIQVTSHMTNPGGSLDNTVVDVSSMSFNMGGNPFSGTLHLVTPMSDPDFKVKALGKIDLGMIKDVYPLEKGTQLNGLLDMNVNAAGKMSYVDKNQYESFTFGGNMTVKNILLKMKGLSQDVSVSNANLIFNNRYLNLTGLQLKIGRNDLNANGKVENYLAYALRDKTLMGDFNISSNYFNVTDFMSGNKEKSKNDTSSLTVIKIPKNLNLSLAGKINELIYDKMDFKNADAVMKVADGELFIQKLNVNAFGGLMALTGKYSTSNPEKPALDFNIDLKQISFSDIFNQVDILQKMAPIFDKAVGKFDSKLSFNTLLQQDMMPVLTSILSNGSFNTSTVALKNVTAFSELTKTLKLDNVTNKVLRDISLMFEIKDGKLQTKPFDVKLGDYAMNLGGSTGLDQTIAYVGKIKLPDKFKLGRFQNVGFKIGGTFKKPKIELDLANTVSSLVEEEKAKALQKVDTLKKQVIDKGRAEREKALQEAQKRADQILTKAKLQGERLINIAKAQGDSLVVKATNPITKQIAKKGAQELVKQAEKQADNLNQKAKTEADKVIQQAAEKTKF